MSQKRKTLTEHNERILAQIERIVEEDPVSVERLQQALLEIAEEPEENLTTLALKIEGLFKKLLMTLLTFKVDRSLPDWTKQCGLPEDRLMSLKKVLEVVCGGPASQKLQRSVVISFIENVLQCLGVIDLTEVLGVITVHIPRFANKLGQAQSIKLMRVINVLLKTVSKTEDYQLRGQLHLTLTKFLPFCHDSGFHFRAPPSKSSEWESIESVQLDEALQDGLTFEFYQQFWQLQKCLIEPHEVLGDNTFNTLRKIEHTLKDIQQYFETHTAIENPDYYNQPVKFLKNYNLLALQLGDLSFRKTIMLQVLLFIHAVKHPYVKTPISLTQADKKVLGEIEAIPKKFLASCGGEGKSLIEQLPSILEGEQKWIEMKEGWKDKKKALMNRAEDYAKQENQMKEEIRKKQKQLEKKRAEHRKAIVQKLKIEGSKFERFLENNKVIDLQSNPTYTSFSYFFSQAVDCLKNFDRETGKEKVFETRAEYNMFEWKAMRSLYRQNLRDIWSSNDKAPPKMKEYRLISLMSKKEEDFTEGDPTKKVKRE